MNREKNSFMLGLISAIAAISLVGFVVMVFAYFQKNSVDSAKANKTEDVNLGVSAKKPSPAAPAEGPGELAEIKITDEDHIRGNKNAPITLVEYSDFQCPYCSRFHDTMEQVMKDFPNDVRWVYKHFPLESIHPYARIAAEASECASEQGKFWEYHDELFANQVNFSADYFSAAAKKLGLNSSKFDQCLSSGKYAARVNSDFQAGQSIGVRGTPGSYINGQALGGAVPYSQLKSMIESLK